MKVAFDTNVLLDVILRRPGSEDSLRLVTALSDRKISGVVSANSITDFYYLSRKGIGEQAARYSIFLILCMFEVASLGGKDCLMALTEPMSDYEDAVLAVCAKGAGADYIATRDKQFLAAESPVPAKTPSQLLDIIG